MKPSSVNFIPARTLPAGKPVNKINSYQRISFNIPQQANPTPENVASLKKRVIDTYSPEKKPIQAPLTIYKYNPTTKTISKISIDDRLF